MYKLSKIATRLVYKIRHHRGHGIHSPFVFKLITNVIEEKKPYYAYKEVIEHWNHFGSTKGYEIKVGKLLFRIANHFNAKKMLVLGSGDGLGVLYMTAVASDVKCVCVEQSEAKRVEASGVYTNWLKNIEQHESIDSLKLEEKQDFIVVDLKHFSARTEGVVDYLFRYTDEQSVVVVKGIRTNKANRLLWKKLIEDERVTVSLDLFHLGILIFNKKYYKRNFNLSF